MTINEKFAYLAGIIDGEGSISIEIQGTKNRKTDYYTVRLIVINTDLRLLEWIESNYGGSIKSRTKYINRKQCYNWVLFSFNAANLLKNCLPYLIVKKQRAEILIEFMNSKLDSYFISKKVQEKRRELYALCKSLNKQGI